MLTELTFVDIPVDVDRAHIVGDEMFVQGGGQCYAAVTAAGAADGNGEGELALFNIVWEKEGDHFFELFQKTAGLRMAEDKLRHRTVETGQRTKLVHIEGIGEKTGVKNQIRIERNPVLEAEGHHGDIETALAAFSCKEREKPVLQNAQGHGGAVYNIVCAALDRREELFFLLHRFLGADTLFRQGMGPAGFLVTPDQSREICVHVEDTHVTVHFAQFFDGIRQFPKAFPIPDIGNEGDLFIAAAGVQTEFGKTGHQSDRQVVDAIIIQVLQHVCGTGLARTGETGDDEKFHQMLLFFDRLRNGRNAVAGDLRSVILQTVVRRENYNL